MRMSGIASKLETYRPVCTPVSLFLDLICRRLVRLDVERFERGLPLMSPVAHLVFLIVLSNRAPLRVTLR